MNATAANSPPFFDELKTQWRRLPDKTVFIVLLLCWISLFHFLGLSSRAWTGNQSLLERVWSFYSDPLQDMGYAKIVPLAVLWLLWHKRERLMAAGSGARWPFLAMLGGALSLHFVGFVAQQESISVVAFFFGIYSLVGVVWGWRVFKETFFPFFLLVFCIPLGPLKDGATFSLQLLATTMTQFVSHDVLGIPLTRVGTKLLKPDGSAFEVVAACSGLRSFTALLLVTTIYSMVGFRQVWKRALLIAATIPLALGCNVLRLVAVVVADRAWGRRIGQWAHESDWIFTYGAALIAIMVIGHWLRERRPVAA